ncbi:MAG: helix-turn-helix domain-containing protein [Burkholderiales bacterium]|nr:helix-turn-helix domain-containing protein [Burkholderiales bacterium]
MPKKFNSQQAAARAVDLLGGPVAAARKLDIERYQTVQSWVKTRVPAEHCPAIERVTNGQVRCEDLRPDVAWDVLRMQAGTVDATAPA